MNRPFEIRITRQAEKDIEKLTPKLRAKLYDILTEVLAAEPWSGYRLTGELAGNYSFHLSYRDRIIYSVDTQKHIVYIKRARTHYGE